MIKKFYKLKRKNIAFIQYIIEGYEGIATTTTIEPQTAIIQLSIIPDFLFETKEIIKDLKNNKYEIEEVNYPEKRQIME